VKDGKKICYELAAEWRLCEICPRTMVVFD
jgi:hypothetical protein